MPWWTNGGSSSKPMKAKKRLPNELISELVNAIPLGKIEASNWSNSFAYDTYIAGRKNVVTKLYVKQNAMLRASNKNLTEMAGLYEEMNALATALNEHFEIQSEEEFAADPENHRILAEYQTVKAQIDTLKQRQAVLDAECSERQAKLEEIVREWAKAEATLKRMKMWMFFSNFCEFLAVISGGYLLQQYFFG